MVLREKEQFNSAESRIIVEPVIEFLCVEGLGNIPQSRASFSTLWDLVGIA